MNDLVKRAIHTFYQTAIPVFVAGVTNVFSAFQHNGLTAGKSALLALATGAIASGISAVKTALVQTPTK